MNTLQDISPRLAEVYTVLSEAEKRNLLRYLQSPFFITDKALSALHSYLLQVNTDMEVDKLLLWKEVFGKQSFNEKRFRYLISDLLESVSDFIYLQDILQQKPGYVRMVCENYTAKNAVLNRSAIAAKLLKPTKAAQLNRNAQWFLEKHFEDQLLEEEHTGSLKEYRKYLSEHRTGEPSGLDTYYLIEKMRDLCTIANDNNVLGLQHTGFNAAQVLEMASGKSFKENPFVQAYWHVYQLLTTRTKQAYLGLKKVIAAQGLELDANTLAELFTYARNYCIARVNAGEESYYNELFDLYEQGLDKNILLVNGELNERNFKNIVTTALRTARYAWALEFINEYKYKLNKRVRDNAVNYNLANYHFHKKEYPLVLRALQKVQLADLFYGLDGRSMMLKCYYETDEKEAFMNTYQSFRVFVQRRKNVSEQHRRNYLNFLRIAKKLINLRPRSNDAAKIVAEIESSKAIADKNWLLEKARVFLPAND